MSPDIRESVRNDAARWLSRRDRGLSPREMESFAAWIAADPEHQAALASLQRTWGALDALSALADGVPDADLLAPRRRTRPAIAAAVLALAAAAADDPADQPGCRAPAPAPAAGPVQVARYAASEVRHVRLDDGSVVDLDAGSAISVLYSAGERRVDLERGEAGFSVARNPARPFTVMAGGVGVRAVGTVFDVRVVGSEVDVLVTEGRVRVARDPRELAGGTAPLVASGQLATVSGPEPVVSDIAPEAAGRLLAWQGEMLTFTDRPLGEVVEEFNRRNATRLVIGDEAIRNIRVGGSFRADGVDAFVRLLEMGFGVSAERRDGTIVLRQAR
jgi:transmembrane sensor